MARSKRITFLSELLMGYSVALDIGSDHGYVLLEAFKKGYIKHGIASDLRIEPLMQAKKNLIGFDAKTIQSDGFLNIHESFDVAMIAGMGSYLIANIMEHAPSYDVTYILQPNDKPEVLRKYLMDHGFMIIDEYVVRDRFDYVIMKVKRGNMALNREDLILGPILKKKEDSRNYYQRKVQLLTKLLKHVDEKRSYEINELIKIYNSIIKP